MATGYAVPQEWRLILPELYAAFEKIKNAYVNESYTPLIRYTNEETGCVLSEDVYVALKRMCFFVQDIVDLRRYKKLDYKEISSFL